MTEAALNQKPQAPTPERHARAAEAGSPIRRVVVDVTDAEGAKSRTLAHVVDDRSSLGMLRRRDVIDADQYGAGRWLQGRIEKSLLSIGSVEIRERVQGGGTITPEMLLAASQDVQYAWSAIEAGAGTGARVAVEMVVQFDQSIEAGSQLARMRRVDFRDRLFDGLDCLASWRAQRA